LLAQQTLASKLGEFEGGKASDAACAFAASKTGPWFSVVMCQIQTWQAPRFLLSLADDFSGWMCGLCDARFAGHLNRLGASTHAFTQLSQLS
jgi:hypothetical protein